MSEKRCTKCGEIKAVGEFYRRKDKRDGLASHCRQCKKEKDAARYAAHPGKVAARMKAWHKAHPEKADAYRKAWRDSGKAAAQRRATKAANIAYLASIIPLQCKSCGYDKSFSALDFHHIDPSQKEHAHDSMGRWILFKLDRFKVKVQNTSFIILCKNCHAELHATHGDSELC